MNCQTFEHWLDDGGPEAQRAPARAHAVTCPRCAAALRVAAELDALLAGAAAPSPAAFTDRVMMRVAAAEALRVSAASIASPFDWWVRIALEPATVLALALAGLLAWRADALVRIGAPLGLRLAAQVARFDLPPLALLHRPGVSLALALAVAPPLIWASWRLYVVVLRACLADQSRAS